jgi:hypothetical protein
MFNMSLAPLVLVVGRVVSIVGPNFPLRPLNAVRSGWLMPRFIGLNVAAIANITALSTAIVTKHFFAFIVRTS